MVGSVQPKHTCIGSHRRVREYRTNTEVVASESACLHLCHQVDVSSGDRNIDAYRETCAENRWLSIRPSRQRKPHGRPKEKRLRKRECCRREIAARAAAAEALAEAPENTEQRAQ